MNSVFHSKLKTFPMTTLKQFRFSDSTSCPNRSNGMNEILCREVPCRCDNGFTCLTTTIEIPNFFACTINLFASGLMGFAGENQAEFSRYVQHSLDDDLADISGNYLDSPLNHFWVAEAGDRIVGIVGVQWRTDEEAELRRMSVTPDVRRQGIGLGLLKTVEDFCRKSGYKRLKLITVSQMSAAIAMYQKFGFRLAGEENYGRLLGQHFVKEL